MSNGRSGPRDRRERVTESQQDREGSDEQSVSAVCEERVVQPPPARRHDDDGGVIMREMREEKQGHGVSERHAGAPDVRRSRRAGAERNTMPR